MENRKEEGPKATVGQGAPPGDISSLSTIHGVRFLIWSTILIVFTLVFAALGVVLAAQPPKVTKSVIDASVEVTVASFFLLGALCAAVMLAMGLARMLRGRGEFGPGHRRLSGVGATLLAIGTLVYLAGATSNASVGATGGVAGSPTSFGTATSVLGSLLFAAGIVSLLWSLARRPARPPLLLAAGLVAAAPLPLIGASPGPVPALSANLLGIAAMTVLAMALRDIYGRILIGESRPTVDVGAEEKEDDEIPGSTAPPLNDAENLVEKTVEDPV